MNKSKRLRFDWVWGTLFRPRHVFALIAKDNAGTYPANSWLTPLLLLTITGLLLAMTTGWVRGQITVEPELSPDFQYLSPEQQSQMMQALQMRQGPIFRYVFPAMTSLLSVWIGWLLVGGLLHLVMTLQGGRGDTGLAINLVAWANLPYALRDIIQIIYLAITRKLIASPGLSGFISAETGGWHLFWAKILTLVDISLFWRLVLLTLGVKKFAGFSIGKALISAVVPILIILLLQAGLGYLGATLGSLSIVRMFF